MNGNRGNGRMNSSVQNTSQIRNQNVKRPQKQNRSPIAKQGETAPANTDQRSTAQRNMSQRPVSQRPVSNAAPPPSVKKRPTPKRRSDLKDNLRSQTPLNRKLRQQTAPSEPGTARRTNAPQYFRVKNEKKSSKQKRKNKQNRSVRARIALLGFIGYVILLILTILIGSLLLPMNISSETDDFRYQLGPNDNVISRKTYSHFKLCRGDTYYIEMDSLADYCDLTTTGDGKVMRYVVRSSGEAIEFVLSESIAYINGVPERTGANAYVSDGKVYIPLEFAQRCFINLDITLDTERNRITIVRKTDGDGNYLDLTFPYKLPSNSESINFAELEVEIQEMIIKQNQPEQPEQPESNEPENGNQP